MSKNFGETVHIMDHPLVAHKLTIMRDKNTSTKDFRELVSEVGMFLAYEATRDLPLTTKEVETPLCTAELPTLAGKKIAVVPILRAGLGFVDGMLSLIPNAKVGFIGLYRDPETHKPVEYYCKLPEDIGKRQIFVVDPMLATGGSAVAAIDFVKQRGGQNIKFMCLIAAPEGLETLQAAHPDVDIYVAAKDRQLNDNAYILPGLGDAGDRIYGTK